MEPIYLSEELVRERTHPWTELCPNVSLQNFLELLPRTYLLVPGRLIYKSDDSHAGKPANEHFGRGDRR
jgi:hypothetical protein